MARPIIDKTETIPARYKTITKARIHGIMKNPMKNVTDPQSIKAIEIPRSREAKPAGVICCIDLAGGVCVLRWITGDWSENSNGVVGDRRMLKIKEESS